MSDALATLKAIHWDDYYPDAGGIDGGNWCAECNVRTPCRTLAMGDDVGAIRALHYSAEYTEKVRDGWFKSHQAIVVLCHEDNHTYPCLTVRLIEEQSG